MSKLTNYCCSIKTPQQLPHEAQARTRTTGDGNSSLGSYKGHHPLRQFPRSKSTTSPQHKRQVRNKLVRAKVRCVCRVTSFPKFHYNDLLSTSPQRTSRRRSYGETCLMDFGHARTRLPETETEIHHHQSIITAASGGARILEQVGPAAGPIK